MANDYNWWTNRETWLVNLHFNPETKADVEWAKECLEEQYESLSPLMQDFVNLNGINWEELKEHMEDEEEETEEDGE